MTPFKELVSPVGSVGASKGQWPFEVAAGDPHLSALLLRASCPGMDSSSGSDVTRTDKFVRFRNRIAQKGGRLHPCRQPPLVFYAVFYLSVSENLIQFPFHGARLGKFQRIRLTDMVGGDAVILCKAQNVADGNAVDDLGRGKPIDLLGKDFLS